MLETFRQRWKETRLSPQAHQEVYKLAAHIRESLRKGDLEMASEQAAHMHMLSQNHLLLHVYGHWTCTKVCLARGQRRSALQHTYLMLVAPYGTVSRRLRSSKPAQVGEKYG